MSTSTPSATFCHCLGADAIASRKTRLHLGPDLLPVDRDGLVRTFTHCTSVSSCLRNAGIKSYEALGNYTLQMWLPPNTHTHTNHSFLVLFNKYFSVQQDYVLPCRERNKKEVHNVTLPKLGSVYSYGLSLRKLPVTGSCKLSIGLDPTENATWCPPHSRENGTITVTNARHRSALGVAFRTQTAPVSDNAGDENKHNTPNKKTKNSNY